MTCRRSETGFLEKLKRPARVLCGILGVLLLSAPIWFEGQQAILVAAAGGLLVVVAVLLPVLTEFEIDILWVRVKAAFASRQGRIQAICEQEKRQLSSLVVMVGVEPSQAPQLVEEAVEDACRLWRGPVVDDLVRQFVLCRTVRLIRIAADIGIPFRIGTPDLHSYGPAGAAFSELDPLHRLMVALVVHNELDNDEVSHLLEVDPTEVEQALSRLALASGTAGEHS